MRPFILPLLALPILAASPPQRGVNLQLQQGGSQLLPTPPVPPVPRRQNFEPAPTPNRDMDGPLSPRADNSPSLAPTLFTRSDQYRGEGFSPGSTAQSEQEKRLKPGAGFSLRMPLDK